MKHTDPVCPSPTSSACIARQVCDERRLCARLHARPIDCLDVTPAVHFVGFRGEEYRAAVRTFGLPDFVHRAAGDIASADTVVFARAKDAGAGPIAYSFDDSNQPDDPAAKERIQ